MAPKEPTWVRLDAVLAIHRRQLSEHGGLNGIRDQGMLESALGRPANKYSYESPKPSLAHLAAAYAFGVAKNHPFIDGNKRTAFVVCELFLRLNKQGLEASAEEKYITFLSLADGTLSEDELAKWIAEHLISRI
jgi:death-on-curing protein